MSEAIYDLFYILPISLVAMLYLVPFFETPQELTVRYACFAAGFVVSLWYKHVKGGLRLLLPVLSLAAGIFVIFLQKPEQRSAFIAEYSGGGLLFPLAVLIFLAGCLVSFLRPVRIAIAAAGLAGLLYALFSQTKPEKAVVAAVLFYIVVCLAEELFHRKSERERFQVKQYLVSLAPFFLLTALVVFAAPAPKKP